MSQFLCTCADGSALQNVHPPERGMAVGGAASPAPTQRHRVVWIWIAADQKWYSADVVDHDTSAHTHRVVYHINGKVRGSRFRCVLPGLHTTTLHGTLLSSIAYRGCTVQGGFQQLASSGVTSLGHVQGEWLDLAAAEREERLRWGDNSAAAAPSGAQEPKPVEQLRQGQFGGLFVDVRVHACLPHIWPFTSCPVPQAHLASCVADVGDGAMPADPEGWRIGVWWPDDGQFYYGAVGTSDGGMPGQPSKHLIHYDDGEGFQNNQAVAGSPDQLSLASGMAMCTPVSPP
jgi:hypothetical protein